MATRDDRIPMDSPERCPHTELIKTQCAHCRVPPPPEFVEAPFDAPGDNIAVTFRARYAGQCIECDGFFECDDWISRTATGDYVCMECTRS